MRSCKSLNGGNKDKEEELLHYIYNNTFITYLSP